jgi:hypothetical protein
MKEHALLPSVDAIAAMYHHMIADATSLDAVSMGIVYDL